MNKVKKVFNNRPVSLTLVALALVVYVIGAFTAPVAMSTVATSLLIGAMLFAVFFDL